MSHNVHVISCRYGARGGTMHYKCADDASMQVSTTRPRNLPGSGSRGTRSRGGASPLSFIGPRMTCVALCAPPWPAGR